MIKLNDNNIIVGQIKQVLKEFNLPNCLIWNRDGYPNLQNKNFIKDSNIYFSKYQSNTYEQITLSSYMENKYYQNITTNFEIENNLYDRYTHRYLGDYLRFLRDRKGVNLMPLYNCFDGEIDKYLTSNELKILINTNPETYIIYKENGYIRYTVPISYDKKYTLSVSTHQPIFAFIQIINNSSETITNLNNKLAGFVIKCNLNKLNLLDIDSLVTNKLSGDEKILLLNNIVNVRLLLDIPQKVYSSIVLLEGDYMNSGKKQLPTLIYKDNIIKQAANPNTEVGINLPYNLQLLDHSNSENALLSDKLIAYMVGNPISSLSESYDIKKLQKELIKEKVLYSAYLGVWDKNTSVGLTTLIAQNFNNLDEKFDVLEYADKDVETVINALASNRGGFI